MSLDDSCNHHYHHLRLLLFRPGWIRPRLGNHTLCRFCFISNVCDSGPVRHDASEAPPKSHRRASCGLAFGDVKSFLQLQRAKHGFRSEARLYAPASCVCEACGTSFCSRTRLVAHLSDAKRPRCLEWLKTHSTPLDPEEVQRLDASDRAHRAQARKAGCTQPRSTGQAVASTGRRLGRFQT